MRMIYSCIPCACQGHNLSPGLPPGWSLFARATSVPMSQCGGTLLPILRQDSPNVAFTHSQNLCRLIH